MVSNCKNLICAHHCRINVAHCSYMCGKSIRLWPWFNEPHIYRSPTDTNQTTQVGYRLSINRGTVTHPSRMSVCMRTRQTGSACPLQFDTATKRSLTLSPPIPLRLYTLPYWSNPPFLISDIRALWCSVLCARAPECQKLKMVG